MGRGHVCSTKEYKSLYQHMENQHLNKIVKSFDEFIESSFNDDGSYNSVGTFLRWQVKIIRIVSGVLLRHPNCVTKLNE